MTHPCYTCPKCGSINLTVGITVTAKLIQHHNSDEFQTETEDDHEWDDFNTMWCSACQHSAHAGDFVTQVLPEVKHLQTLELPHALWWFIENIDADHKDRSDIFFYLRERVRTEAQ